MHTRCVFIAQHHVITNTGTSQYMSLCLLGDAMLLSTKSSTLEKGTLFKKQRTFRDSW